MPFSVLMSKPSGRALRVLAGAALMTVGAMSGRTRVPLSLTGLVMVLAGASNTCLIAPVLRQPFQGVEILAPAAASSR